MAKKIKLKPKKLVKIKLEVREDCAEDGCTTKPEDCDVCHVHGMPINGPNEEGLCGECIAEQQPKKSKAKKAEPASCAVVGRQVHKALEKLATDMEFASYVSLDVAPLDEEGWTADYAYLSYDLEFIDAYGDVGRLEDRVFRAIEKALGPQFKVCYNLVSCKKYPAGTLVALVGSEIEIMRLG